jgi:hypothetical protein
MNPNLEVGELLMHRSLNSSVDHGCNMSIKMIRFYERLDSCMNSKHSLFRSLLF